jgi:Extracellular link domain
MYMMDASLGNINQGNITQQDVYNILSNPSFIIIVVVVICGFVLLFSTFQPTSTESTESAFGNIGGPAAPADSSVFGLSGIGMGTGTGTADSSSSLYDYSSWLFIFIIVFIVIVAVIHGVAYFYGFNIVAKLKDVFSGKPMIDISVKPPEPATPSSTSNKKTSVPEIMRHPQVFNIPGNEYIYEDAKSLCKAYGSRLATYKEVEEAYKEGGEWCNYGWSDDQMALFPTQQKTWENLQKIEGHEHDCGRPGVNGGYMANPLVKYGVNCYGFKPRMNSTEEELMATEPLYPKTLKDTAMENRVNYWKDKLNDILVSPFNANTWSRA